MKLRGNSLKYRLISGFVLIFLCLSVYANAYADQGDPFLPYLNGEAPRIVKDLGEKIQDSVRIRKVVFHSRDVETSSGKASSEIFAAIVSPNKPGKFPAILVLHGGGGWADIDRAVFWSSKGYVILVLDEPGIANPEKANPESKGPWKATVYGKNFFTASPDVRASSIFDGVLASLQGLYLLRDQANVIKDRIGVDGISWGGYATTMISSLAAKYIRASFSTFGSGFYDEGSTFLKELDKIPASEKALWLKYLDAGRRASKITKPFFLAAAANDAYFYPPAVMKTLMTIKSGSVNQLFGPNISHKIDLPGGGGPEECTKHPGWLAMEETYFDYFLKDKGVALPLITAASEDKANKRLIKFHVKTPLNITEAKVFYSLTNAEWPKRVWIAVLAKPTAGGWYVAELPASLSDAPVDWYATVSDARPVSASSLITRSN